MNKILSNTTKTIKTGFQLKKITDKILHPLSYLRDVAKSILVSTIVFIVKNTINLFIKNKESSSTNIIVRQIAAISNKDTDMTGLQKNFSFNLTLDSLLKEAQLVEQSKFLNLIDTSFIKNKIYSSKNSLRDSLYDYLTENNFSNILSLTESVNEVFKIPTEIVGCEFVNCFVSVLSHDSSTKSFELKVDVSFALKST